MKTSVDKAAARRLDRTVTRAGEALKAMRKAFFADVEAQNIATIKKWLASVRVGAAVRCKEQHYIALGGKDSTRALDLISEAAVSGTVERVEVGRKWRGVWMRTPQSSMLVWVDAYKVRHGHAAIEGSPFPTLLKDHDEWVAFLGREAKR